MKKIVVVLSGGMDSVTLLHHHFAEGDAIRAVAVDYGQRHRREISYARMQAKELHVPFVVADLNSLAELLPGSSQTDTRVEVPEGHYAQESMKQTVVPNRNMILLSLAIGHAVAHRFDAVSYAAHTGDHAIYPDCREEFVEALDRAAGLADWHPVRIERPFINLSKADIVRRGTELAVNYRNTYSCYRGGPVHCGRCGTCVERILAFKEAGVIDPTTYQDHDYARQFA